MVYLVGGRLIVRQKLVDVVLYTCPFEALRDVANYKRPGNSTSDITRVTFVTLVTSLAASEDCSSLCIQLSCSTLLPARCRLSTSSWSISSLYCSCCWLFVLLSSCSRPALSFNTCCLSVSLFFLLLRPLFFPFVFI